MKFCVSHTKCIAWVSQNVLCLLMITPPPGDTLHINSDKNFWKEMKMRPLQFNCESIQTAPFPAGLFLRQDFWVRFWAQFETFGMKKKRAGQGGNIYFFFPFRFLCSQASELKFTLKLRPAESSRKVSLWWFKCEMFRLPWEQTPLKAASLRGAGITALHTCLIQDTKFLTHAIVMTPCALFVLCT